MKRRHLFLLILLAVFAFGLGAIGCGGGGGTPNQPSQVGGDGDGGTDQGDDPAPQPPAGDPSDPQTPGFQPTGEFPDFNTPVVSVAVSSDRIYVATQENVFSFNKNGRQVAVAESTPPTPIVDMEVTPNLVEELPDGSTYSFPEYPVIQGQPGGSANTGIRVLSPTLDAITNIDDQGATDLKAFDLPRHWSEENRIIPNVTAGDPPWFCITAFNGLEIIPSGAILAAMTVRDCQGNIIDPNAMALFDPMREGSAPGRFRMYFPEGAVQNFDEDQQDDRPDQLQTPYFPSVTANPDFQLGGTNGTIPMRFGSGISENQGERTLHEFFFEDNALNRDYYGRTNLVENRTTVPFEFNFDPPANNQLGFGSVIGSGIGGQPGEFASQGPPEDPRVAGGGPAGVDVNTTTGEIYIADPGNRRVQVFNDNGEHIRDIGTGEPGTTGRNLVAPIDVTVDELTGTVYIVDQTRVRAFNRVAPATEFGDVVGKVENTQTQPPTPVAQASVTLLDEFGVVSTDSTDSFGNYGFSNLPVTSYTVKAAKGGFESDQGTVNLIPDETVRLDLRLEPVTGVTTGSVQGTVLETGTNLAIDGATVRLLGTSISTQTGADGSFSLNEIQAGQYQISISATGFQTEVRDLFISERTTQQMTFRLERSN